MAFLAIRQRAPVASRARVAALAMIGAMLPDLIDKTLLLFRIYPWGRTVGHSVLTWLLVGGIVALISATTREWAPTRWMGIGIFSHFLADATDDIFSGFLHTSYPLTSWFVWPLKNPDQWEWRVDPLLPGGDIAPTLYEMAVIFGAALLMAWDARQSAGGDFDCCLEDLDVYPREHVVSRRDDQP